MDLRAESLPNKFGRGRIPLRYAKKIKKERKKKLSPTFTETPISHSPQLALSYSPSLRDPSLLLIVKWSQANGALILEGDGCHKVVGHLMPDMLGFAWTRGEVGCWCMYLLIGRNRARLAKNTQKKPPTFKKKQLNKNNCNKNN